LQLSQEKIALEHISSVNDKDYEKKV